VDSYLSRVRDHASNHQLLALALAWIVPFLLFAFIPYSQGYGPVPESAFKQFLNLSKGSPDWGHCLFVLPVALIIFVHTIYDKPLPPPATSWLGLVFVTIAFASFWAGQRMGTHFIGFFAFQAMVIGSIWFVLGGKAVLFFGFPLVFLAFAWPVPFLDNYIAFPLRMLMSQAAVFSLDFIGIHVVRSGTGILSAPDPLLGIPAGKKFAVDVADPCSGIRSLFSLMMASALYGYMAMKNWWQKWLLFLFSGPLAIAGNLARILMLTIGTIVFGSEFAIGKNALSDPSWFHMAAGYLVFIVALGGMVGLSKILLNASSIRDFLSQGIKSLTLSFSRRQNSTPALQTPQPPARSTQKKFEDDY